MDAIQESIEERHRSNQTPPSASSKKTPSPLLLLLTRHNVKYYKQRHKPNAQDSGPPSISETVPPATETKGLNEVGDTTSRQRAKPDSPKLSLFVPRQTPTTASLSPFPPQRRTGSTDVVSYYPEDSAAPIRDAYESHPSQGSIDNIANYKAYQEDNSIAGNPNTADSPYIFISPGTDVEIDKKQTLPYAHVKMLGHGASASVEMVRDQNTQEVFARKIFRNVSTRNLEDAKKSFRNEVLIMRRLAAHPHVVKLHATYLVSRELALILTPVADGGDLASFLQEYRDIDQELRNHLSNSSAGRDPHNRDLSRKLNEMDGILTNAFGCLASALAFMHKQTIRHRDIKPQNILIHQGRVLYTDFGISLDFSSQDGSTTTGNPLSFTRKYCAPEVAEHEKRNSKSDVFSLGCVYLEITATLFPERVLVNALDGPFYKTISSEFLRQFSAYSEVGMTLQRMLALNSGDRPSALDVALSIHHETRRERTVHRFFCQHCSSYESLY